MGFFDKLKNKAQSAAVNVMDAADAAESLEEKFEVAVDKLEDTLEAAGDKIEAAVDAAGDKLEEVKDAAELKVKESDRGMAMHEELQKLGGGLIFGENTIIVPKQQLQYKGEVLDGHNDHRIVMAMSVILSKIGGAIDGAQAIRKSYPGFFDDIKQLGAEVELK